MPIKSFYDSWREAVKDAGFPDLLFHDLRPSAVRNMVQKIGMSAERAMEINGHKTRSCFERYHIVSFADIRESGAKMDTWIKPNIYFVIQFLLDEFEPASGLLDQFGPPAHADCDVIRGLLQNPDR